MTSPSPAAQTQRPRVLIVEPDGQLALATVRACLEAGLEPKLCMGPDETCPGLSGHTCDRAARVEASLVSIASGLGRIASPACAGGRVVLAGERPLVGHATVGMLAPEAVLDYPYNPNAAAGLLLQIVRRDRSQQIWDQVRSSGTDT
ncbi:MAG TPA: hypothetical protein VFK89_00950 [Actinomycetota bacterium]|nr:hypothetical protein [Actinomycetota bacterium]